MPVRLRRSSWLKEKNQKQQTRDRKPNLYSNRAKGGVMQWSQQAEVAQSVEQRTENPRVDGSIPPLGTLKIQYFKEG